MALLTAVCLFTAVSVVVPPVQAQAAAKSGLVKKGSKYYYYKKGKKLINKWKKVKQKKVKYKFYFGKKGAAYKASNPFNKAYNVKLFKIGKKKYGFDNKSHLVAPGVYVDSKSKIYAFGKKGVYDSKTTKDLRSRFASGKRSKTLLADLEKALGEPLKTVVEKNSCNDAAKWNNDSYIDVVLQYKYFEVIMVQNEKTGEYAIDCFLSRKV